MRSPKAQRLIALCALGLGGCARSCATSGPAPVSLVLGTIGEPSTLDPLFSDTAGAAEIVRLLFRDLTQYDDRWQVVPALAARIPTATTSTAGRQRVEWTLAPGLSWSDGRPVVAADVAFAHRIEIDETLEVRGLEHARRIEAIRVIDARRFEVVWRGPQLGFAAPQVHPILPAHAYPDPAKSPRPFAGMGRAPLANGPYRLLKWTPGQSIELEPNPHWSGPRPGIERLMWRFFQTEEAFEAELLGGGIDALGEGSGLSTERARSLGEQLAATHEVQLTDSGSWLHLDVRLDHPIAGLLEVRRAIDLAIDRGAIVELAYEGAAIAAGGCFPPKHPAHRGLPTTRPDLDRAAELLERVGFGLPDDGGPRQKAGVPLSLGLMYARGSSAGERAAAYLQSQLEKVGIEISLEAVPLATLFERMREKKHPALVLYAWRLRPDWDLVSVLRSGGAQNYTGVADPELDAALDRALTAEDPAAWAEALAAAERRFAQILPAIPLVFRASASLRPRWLEGWRPTGTTTPVTWNAETWVRREHTPE
jgi:peptide/nickel transport system substrate-binding protein